MHIHACTHAHSTLLGCMLSVLECHGPPAVHEEDVDNNALPPIWEQEKHPDDTSYEADMPRGCVNGNKGFQGLSFLPISEELNPPQLAVEDATRAAAGGGQWQQQWQPG